MKKFIFLSLFISSAAFSSVTSNIVSSIERIASEGKLGTSIVSRSFEDAAKVAKTFRESVEPGYQMSLRSRSGTYLFVYSNPKIYAGEFSFPGGVSIKFVRRIISPFGPEGRNFPGKRAIEAAVADLGIAGKNTVISDHRLFGGWIGEKMANYREEIVVLPAETVQQLTIEDLRFVLERAADI